MKSLRTMLVTAAAGVCVATVLLAADNQTIKIRDLTLTVPKGWKHQEPSSQMRVAQFQVPPVEGDKEPGEMVISFFGGDAGGVAANVKRWVGQFQPENRKAKMMAGESPQGNYVIADISGTYNQPIGPPIAGKTKPMPNARMIAVILSLEGKGNYFLKLTGPDKTVAAAADDVRLMIGGNPKAEKPYEE